MALHGNLKELVIRYRGREKESQVSCILASGIYKKLLLWTSIIRHNFCTAVLRNQTYGQVPADAPCRALQAHLTPVVTNLTVALMSLVQSFFQS